MSWLSGLFGGSGSLEYVIKNMETDLYVQVNGFDITEGSISDATRFPNYEAGMAALDGLPGDISKYYVEKY